MLLYLKFFVPAFNYYFAQTVKTKILKSMGGPLKQALSRSFTCFFTWVACLVFNLGINNNLEQLLKIFSNVLVLLFSLIGSHHAGHQLSAKEFRYLRIYIGIYPRIKTLHAVCYLCIKLALVQVYIFFFLAWQQTLSFLTYY